MLKVLKGDLHIHTCLSPCADKDMMPGKIVEKAIDKQLNIIGICDHNSWENVFAVKKRGIRSGIAVLGGIEITSSEEVHIIALFDEDSSLLKIGEIVYENLLPRENDETLFGEQLVCDEYDQVIKNNKRFLIGATNLKIEEIVDIIHRLHGLAIASHVDREAFSIIGQLGFIPEGLRLDAVELSPQHSLKKNIPLPQNLAKVFFSDAHKTEEIGNAKTSFLLEKATVGEIRMALLNRDGRKVLA
jgi:hypothetical protein